MRMLACDILLKFRGRSRVQDRMIWIGTEGGRDCYLLQMVCPSESTGWFRCPRSCFCCVQHLRVSSSCASCSRGAYFRKKAGARKPRTVAGCWLHSDWFRWAKHDVLVNDRQSSADWCIAQFRRHIVQIDVFDLDVCHSILMYVNIEYINLNDVATKLMSQLQPIQAAIVADVAEIFSVPDAFVPPLPPEQPVLGSGTSIWVALLWCCQETLVLGRCCHFRRADSAYLLRQSLPQSCAPAYAWVAGLHVCQSRCSLCLCPVASMAAYSFGRDKRIEHRCCRHCSKSRPRSPGAAVTQWPFGFSQITCGKKPHGEHWH